MKACIGPLFKLSCLYSKKKCVLGWKWLILSQFWAVGVGRYWALFLTISMSQTIRSFYKRTHLLHLLQCALQRKDNNSNGVFSNRWLMNPILWPLECLGVSTAASAPASEKLYWAILKFLIWLSLFIEHQQLSSGLRNFVGMWYLKKLYDSNISCGRAVCRVS